MQHKKLRKFEEGKDNLCSTYLSQNAQTFLASIYAFGYSIKDAELNHSNSLLTLSILLHMEVPYWGSDKVREALKKHCRGDNN